MIGGGVAAGVTGLLGTSAFADATADMSAANAAPADDGRLEAAAIDRKAHLYFLCDIDVPWTPDGLRDRGDKRDEMHELFKAVLDEARATFVVLRGSRDDRLGIARRHVDALPH